MHGIESLSNIIERRARKHGLGNSVEAEQVCDLFMEELKGVDQRLYEKVEPIYFKNNVIYVSIPSSAWAHQLMMCQYQVLKLVRKRVVKDVFVKRIRYRVRGRD